MKSTQEKYSKPLILDHRTVRFETAHSWNPGVGKQMQTGNGTNFPSEQNPNPTAAGAGTPGNGKGYGNGN